jgi:hypothetical protein
MTTPEPSLTPLRIPKPLKKKLAKKDRKMQAAILACLRQLREDWQHPGLESSKLGGTNIYHAKVGRGGRVTFFWEGERIVVENHCHHDILKRY